MSKHTPGPWNVIEGVADGGGIAIGPDLEDVGPHALVTFNGGESEANARLIAAAPDLLEVLQDGYNRFETMRYVLQAIEAAGHDLPMEYGSEIARWVERAAAAIARTEGES